MDTMNTQWTEQQLAVLDETDELELTIAGKTVIIWMVLLADMRLENAQAAADVLSNAGYDVSVTTVDVSSRQAIGTLAQTATAKGEVTGLIHAAGPSPSQAAPSTILKVDLYGTALVLEQFGEVIVRGGAGGRPE